jgi:hypothetical protein
MAQPPRAAPMPIPAKAAGRIRGRATLLYGGGGPRRGGGDGGGEQRVGCDDPCTAAPHGGPDSAFTSGAGGPDSAFTSGAGGPDCATTSGAGGLNTGAGGGEAGGGGDGNGLGGGGRGGASGATGANGAAGMTGSGGAMGAGGGSAAMMFVSPALVRGDVAGPGLCAPAMPQHNTRSRHHQAFTVVAGSRRKVEVARRVLDEHSLMASTCLARRSARARCLVVAVPCGTAMRPGGGRGTLQLDAGDALGATPLPRVQPLNG